MNRNKLKTYAPQARRDFIQAVTDRATQYGLTAKKIEPLTEQGEVVLIDGQPFPKSVGVKRKKLEARIEKLGFGQTMEAMAYTWFNRLVAIRFMELHGYLEHGFRVLSHPEGHPQPEILEHAQHVDLPGLDQKKVVELKLDGTKEEELYRLLLIAQCNALHKALPFLFESIDDETELLLPDHLLHSDSLIRNLVNEIDDADWEEVEIIGWLYESYVSERYDAVIGKVVPSEDIPAATQRFTPNWIVKYLVENTLGRQWLAIYPHSPLKGQMQYYIEPAEQTHEVQDLLKTITPTSLNPEELTLLDPACGSGHILVEAYDVFKAIYQERGYRAKDIPAFILENNLYGLEIDDRAAQLAAFALMMKARADDRRIFDSDAKPNILAFQDSGAMKADDIAHALNSPILTEPMPPKEMLFEEIEEDMAGLLSKKSLAEKGHILQGDIATLLGLFENAKTFGSLIQVPPTLAAKLPEIEHRLVQVKRHGNLTHALAHAITPILRQARLLGRQYDAVVANPPYMGGKYLVSKLKSFVADQYEEEKADLYACFITRSLQLAKVNGLIGMITIPNWMFIASFAPLRESLLGTNTIDTFIHNGRGVFGSDFGSCSFVFKKAMVPEFRSVFRRLFEKQGSVIENDELKLRYFTAKQYVTVPSEFRKIPGSPIAYWASKETADLFSRFSLFEEFGDTLQGMTTCDNDRYVRYWWEVAIDKVGIAMSSREEAKKSGKRWFPYTKGGPFRRWFGNNECVIDWYNDGEVIRSRKHPTMDKVWAHNFNLEHIFNAGITYSSVGSTVASFRYSPPGSLFDQVGSMVFVQDERSLLCVLGLLNSSLAARFFAILCPTIHFNPGSILKLPISPNILADEALHSNVERAVAIATEDWNASETSLFFRSHLASNSAAEARTLEQWMSVLSAATIERQNELRRVESHNESILLRHYSLTEDCTSEVDELPMSLCVSDREENIKRLVSYAIGCMMGRYSLDKPELIYAHSGNKEFDASQYTTFESDDDGILPITEFNWFPDDAANRFETFIGTAWPVNILEVNLRFVAESIGPKKGESSLETIRRYIASDFFKDHLSMYKRRPIYWLFSSGKQRGFQALVYLHRYNEGTLARMRTEYVIPLLGKMTGRIDHLTDEIAAASSSQHRKRLETEKVTITKQLAEVQAFEEKLRHYADQRIKLDLDDGVKINYGKFSDPEIGDILAEVKAITGGKDEE